MTNRPDTAFDDILEGACQVAAARRTTSGVDARTVRNLLRAYYHHVSAEELAGRDAEDVYGAAMSHFRLAGRRPQGTVTVQVSTPNVDEHGWSAAGHTVVEVVTDDMPFLVDSVTMYLARHDHGIHLVIHPQLSVERDVAGDLRGLALGTPGESGVDEAAGSDGQGAVDESWMHVEIDRVEDADRLAELEAGLSEVLRDVRETVEDWTKMRERVRSIVQSLRAEPPPVPEDETEEVRALLDWLADDHFTFLGYREYALGEPGEEETGRKSDVLRALPGTGLGILRSDPRVMAAKLPGPVAERARDMVLAVITKANSRATVHRSAYLDYIGIRTFGPEGEVTGERRFLGLFSSAAYTESVTRIPILRRKAVAVLEQLGFHPMSHSGKALLDLLETYPRDDLFQTPVDELASTLKEVLRLQERRQLRLFVRQDAYRRYLSCLVYLPRDRYTTQVRERMQTILAGALGGPEQGVTIDYTARVTESVLARLHFVVRPPRGTFVGEVDQAALEQRLSEATRSWADDFGQAAYELRGEADGARLVRAYGAAFPEAYKEDFGARVAVTDLHRLESVDPDDGIGLHLYEPADAPPGEGRFKIFRTGTPLSLTEVLPLFTSLGVEVVDERPYSLMQPNDQEPIAWIYDFGLRYDAEPGEVGRRLLTDAFLACWRGKAEADSFNRLVLAARLPWRQVSVLRAYARWLRQAATPFSQAYIEDTLLAHCGVARQLMELFAARFDPGEDGQPADSEDRATRIAELSEGITSALDDVASLDHDRILRAYVTAINATMRTNYYVLDDDGNDRPYLSLKLEPERLPDMPLPRPRFEVFVYSPRVEGVHLRFGHVARGGLRWSDRREDFRTEVLGLVKAQMVKNAVIVPVGAKGGFYAKQLPDPAADRDAWMAEGIECYRTFICGLLDITDNLEREKSVPPPRVVRHDGDDAYLVVAADKGTATFSDIANGIALEYDFWLGDAFASGGSAGYDHKAMGITARGAWESVKRHFREMGTDCQHEDFTCVGVGDMSGDVFGNGMLLSPHTRLVAAFDHRHVFIDPEPDAETSYAERRRLFELPRSSWDDYDRSLLSAGGGIYPREAKSVPVSPQARAALDLDESVQQLSPAQLVTAILKAPVDLLWNGGIGTYVKAASETHAEAGDKANDAVRVNGAELRARCVGEGGNLGLTQLGRIEYARSGGRITTDFIDNSAGVDTSDHEVNIKVLLDRVVTDGDLTDKQRNVLLQDMTDEVAELVLTDNVAQNIALANAEAASGSLMHVHADWMRRLERGGRLDREIEFLPSTKEIERRRSEGRGLSSPELAVLLAYTKIVLSEELLDTDLPDDPFMRANLYRYFPTAMRQSYRDRMDSHPLRREIVVTQVVNSLVNDAGITFFHRLSGETGATADELARAYAIASEIYGAEALYRLLRMVDNEVDAAVQTQMRLDVRQLVERATRWLVNQRWHADAERTVEEVGTAVQEVVRGLSEILAGRENERLQARAEHLRSNGVADELALRVAALPTAYSALAVVEVARRLGRPPLEVARVHSALGQRLNLDVLYDRVVDLARNDRWQTMARATLRDDLQEVHAAMTARVLETDPNGESTDSSFDVDARIEAWVAEKGTVFTRALSTLNEICRDESADLARLSVALRVTRTLVA